MVSGMLRTMVHVLRAANNVAHCLANEASSKVIDSVWLEDMPSVIFRMLYLGSILVPRSHFLDQFLFFNEEIQLC